MNWQELLRDTWQTSLVFVSLLLFTRILGKTQVGQLTFYEYISGITIGSIAATIAGSEPDRVWSHFYDLLLFVLLTFLLSQITIRSRPLRKLIDGTPTIVIRDGVILENNMRSMRYDLDELNCQLRQQGILDPSEVQFAFVETTGDLSIVKKTALQAVTKGDMGISTAAPVLPVELIMDGELITENLLSNTLSREWLMQELSNRNIRDIASVTYAVLDSKQQLFVSLKNQHTANNEGTTG